jgi:hypothetical protein
MANLLPLASFTNRESNGLRELTSRNVNLLDNNMFANRESENS